MGPTLDVVSEQEAGHTLTCLPSQESQSWRDAILTVGLLNKQTPDISVLLFFKATTPKPGVVALAV